MRIHCGDYRTKMNKEEQNFTLKTNVSAKKSGEKSIFLRKQERKPSDKMTGKMPPSSQFKFNFNIDPDDTEENSTEQANDPSSGVTKFKMNKSDNAFRFNFSID